VTLNEKALHIMVSYECCGVKFRDSKVLSGHMKVQHKMSNFNVELTCCGTTFVEARELMDHVSTEHHYQMKLET